MIRVEQDQDFLMRIFTVVALKRFHVHPGGISLVQARRKLHLAVDNVIVLDEPPDKTNDDERRRRTCGCCRNGRIAANWRDRPALRRSCPAKRKNSRERKNKNADRNLDSTK